MLRLPCSDHHPAVLRNLLRRRPAARDQRALDRVGRYAPDGPSLGLGVGAMEAIEAALEPFEGIVDELMASLPGSMIG